MDNYKLNYYKKLLGDMKTSERIRNDREIDELYNLFDEEITRQLAGSEEVREALEQMNDALDPQYLESDGEWTGYNEFSTNTIRTAIVALQTYQPWISVEDRLPDGDVASVLIYTNKGGVSEGQYYPSIKSWKQFRWSVENADVTHWKPLPEPPKGE